MCRGFVNNSLQPGRIRSGLRVCYIPYGGAEVNIARYQVLVGGGFSWVPASRGIPDRAVQAGYDIPPQSPPLFICRASYKGGLYPGKTRPDWNSCNIGWGGREFRVLTYAVLVR